LTVYNTEKELVRAYEAKFRLAQLTIDLLKARHKKQSQKLEKLENDHERMKDLKYKDAVAKEIEDVLDNLKIYQQAITENRIEKDKIHKEFESTLSHYKQLAAKKSTKY
jgi:multidrug resistance efflux pump